MMKKIWPFIFMLLLWGCGTYRTAYYGPEDLKWGKAKLPDKAPEHTLFLVGDAGDLDDINRGNNFVLDAVNKDLLNTQNPSTLVFLGDNLYPQGLPSKKKKSRALMEKKINASLELARSCSGNTYFIPGNHDWKKGRKGGLKAIERQEKYIESYFNDEFDKKVKLYPGQGCGDPKVIKVNKDLVYVFLDTQWWLQNWDNEKKMNKGCSVKSRAELLRKLEEILMEHKNDEVVMLMHHPIKSNGMHGGKFGFQHHLFPLHQVHNLWIPLPFIGSAYPIFRQTTGSIQDISHKNYQELIDGILKIAHDLEVNMIFTSGHDHNLQYFEEGDLRFIISGSGSRQSYVARGGDAGFVRNARGYAKLMFYKNNEAWVEFYTVDGFENEAQLAFRKQLRKPKAGTVSVLKKEFPSIQEKDTIVAANPLFKAGKGKQIWLGKQYRDIWATPVKVPMINLETKLGGLKPVKKGGGMSSNSLRLEAKDGKEYILRSIKKDYTKLVDERFSNLKAMDILKDQNSASHPYGALMLPSLSKAVGIYATQPELVYLKHQKGLGNYNAFFPEELYLLEQRPDGDWSDADYFGNCDNIIGYTDLLLNLQEKKTHFVDQKWVLKSRLFDMWVHDWDRHDDQWRWATFEEEDKTIYRPIPRDRDQAFYKFEGIIPWYASAFIIKKFKTMKEDVKDVKSLAFNARYFDRYFLNGLEWKEWENIVAGMQAALSDEVIEASINGLPKEVREQNKDLVRLLKSRRDNLRSIARKWYTFISREVEISGTDDDDVFYIENCDDGCVRITFLIPRKKKGDIVKLKRVFYPDETKEIRLYGLRGKDEFVISGEKHPKIKVRIIGGEDKDKVENTSNSGKVVIYDQIDGAKTEGALKDKTSDEIDINEYEREAFKYNSGLPMLKFGYTKDDGVWIGASHTWTLHGWRKDPFKSKHKAYSTFAPGSEDAFTIGYSGRYTDVIGKLDFMPDFNVDYPLIENFFGYGNESTNYHLPKEYNWVRKRSIKVSPLWGWYSRNERRSFVWGPVYETVRIENNRGRVAEDPLIGFTDEELDRKHFAGASFKYSISSVDRENNPSSGFKWFLGYNYMSELSSKRSFWHLESGASLYLTLTNYPKVVLANASGYELMEGEAQFYQYPSLGNRTHLRGFRNNRFRGEAILFNNSDVRMHLVNWDNAYVPMDVGIIGGYDIGRVWLDGENSNHWHSSHTLGIWMDVLELFILQPYYSFTEEGDYLSFSMSFTF